MGASRRYCIYVSAPDIRRAIEYDFEHEKHFDYIRLNINQITDHITQFVSGLWQIHPLGKGNTRATAVFTIQYLHSMGFNVENDLFVTLYHKGYNLLLYWHHYIR